nr:MAG: hypothetical protein A2V48_02270 [Candidatus Amesbacteria bacterium RBG_19FT_COMBO_48_16]
MPSASEIYLQKKAEQERLAREAEARTKAKEQAKRELTKKLEAERAAEERRERELEAAQDRIAKQFLDKNVVGQLKDLRKATGGKVYFLDDRNVHLAIRTERKEYINGGITDFTKGVSVEIEFDEQNKGHLLINREEVGVSKLPQALARAALNPSYIESKTIEHGHYEQRLTGAEDYNRSK